MIVEHALLPVSPGRESEFEAAMRGALDCLTAAHGFLGVSLSRCIEVPGTYLLTVQWQRLEDHTEGFRRSPAYQRWRELLHPFYDPAPEVTHFTPVEL